MAILAVTTAEARNEKQKGAQNMGMIASKLPVIK
jgi:hypothetical protein